jgi:hypothetical protein
VLEFENAIYIDRPIDKVLSVLSDFKNIAKWNSEGPIAIGTTYHTKCARLTNRIFTSPSLRRTARSQ